MKNKKKTNYLGSNWNNLEDEYTHFFYEQNLSQFWRPEDISLQGDLKAWDQLSDFEKTIYSRNLLVLTFLDTYQGDIGMSVIGRSLDDHCHQRKATISFMGAMENAIHAKSYSNIFMTFLDNQQINALFVWGKQQRNLQNIIHLIVDIYQSLEKNYVLIKYNYKKFSDNFLSQLQWQAMVASVFLETWLFYSGFYYPLFFYSQGKLMQSGEIINLIIRDESVHGVYIGRLASEIYHSFDVDTQLSLKKWMYSLLENLYREQKLLIKDIYQDETLIEDVNKFMRYNANKALMNLGFDIYFSYETVNPVILNGLNTETKTMDNFSMKGNGYQKMKSEALIDEDFIFDQLKIND